MKKLFAILLALGLLALCACTSKSNTTAEVPEITTETPSEETLSQQERLFRQTEALRQKAMAEARAAHKQAQGFSAKRI